MKNIAVVLMIATGTFLVNLDAGIVNIALPTLCIDLKTGPQEVAWVVLVYLCAMGSLLLFTGKLGDTLGSKRIFITGFAVFSAGSLFCALAHEIFVMYLGRLIQGVGAACIMANFGAILLSNLPSDFRGRAFGLNTVLGGVGYAMGAPLGGWLIHTLSWRWIFWINLPLGILAIVGSILILKKDPVRKSGIAHLDLPGLFFSVVSVTLFLLMLNRGFGDHVFSAPYAAALTILLVCTALFVRRELRIKQPLLEIPLFLSCGTAACIIANMAFVVGLEGMNFMFPFYFTDVLRMNVAETGFYLMCFPIVSIVISPLAGFLSDKFGARIVVILASGLTLASTFGFYLFSPELPRLVIIAVFAAFGIGLASFFTSNITLFMGNSPSDKAGMFMAVASTGTAVGSALGVGLFSNFLDFSHDAAAASRTMQIESGFKNAIYAAVIFAVIAFIASILSKSGPSVVPEQEHTNE